MSTDDGLPIGSPSPRRVNIIFGRRKALAAALVFLFFVLVLWVIRGDSHVVAHTGSGASTLVATNPALLNPGPVTFALIIMSMGDVAAAKILMKSILIHNTLPSTFHIFCSPDVSKSMLPALRLITRPRHDTRVIFYHLSWPSMRARIEREGNLSTDDQNLPSLMKLFLHEILPASTNFVIALSPSALFLSDPAALWLENLRLAPPAAPAAALYYDSSNSKVTHANAHVLLLNLDKLREVRLMDSRVYRKVDHAANGAISSAAFRVALGPPLTSKGARYDVKEMGGEEIFWRALVGYRPDLFWGLEAGYVVEGCSRKPAGLDSGDAVDGGAIIPRLVHFDCVKHRPYTEWRGWDDPDALVTRQWGAAVQYYANFKWLWLNSEVDQTLDTAKGNETTGSSTTQHSSPTSPHGSLKMHVIKDGIIFGDERYAMQHRPQP
ncbi:uncharacterized protein SCHCODRAFT_02615309 [Schizophyllum commune H4-8]|nr:uncharacterized protein SCHCODRAFT_02615309 [Schizophyllum commune H4-8]KAI5896599.1 hypothetical protein SCHCODRAFT_02615309 [Schizophyllum commune H4-8]